MPAPLHALEVPADAMSIARLHGEACTTCGSARGPLAPAGHVYMPGELPNSRLGWTVVACSTCLPEREP